MFQYFFKLPMIFTEKNDFLFIVTSYFASPNVVVKLLLNESTNTHEGTTIISFYGKHSDAMMCRNYCPRNKLAPLGDLSYPAQKNF